MSKLHELANLGQAIWLDDIRRSYFAGGELKRWAEMGLRGLTSNPTIFEKAISSSLDYQADLHWLRHSGKNVTEIYEALAIDDIRRAADLLRPLYDQTGGADGFVSLEVSPELAHDAAGTAAQAERLFQAVGRPNLMIKIPATPAGLPAIRATLGKAINVNVTLIFSLAQYEAVIEAHLAGLEDLAAAGGDLGRTASVASFFVSRVDTAVDRELQAIMDAAPGTERAALAQGLLGKIAVANAQAAYARFQEVMASERWQRLQALGARPQRPLWASTGTKNPAYPDLLYVDTLVGPETVNTLPPATLAALLDHGQVERTIDRHPGQALAELECLAGLGIDLAAITQKLQDEGVTAFIASFRTLMDSITRRSQADADQQDLSLAAGERQAAVEATLARMDQEQVIERIWAGDHTVWKPEPTEISDRLGWLRVAEAMESQVDELDRLAAAARAAGYTQALLLGMGGSSLAPEVLSKTFDAGAGHLKLEVLDSTDPGAVLRAAERLDPRRTLYIVATKSGGTVETFSFFKYFYNQVAAAVGASQAGAHFIAITDPGSYLAGIAGRLGFRACLLNDPNIGGRYSALSYFGLAPAALAGIEVRRLLQRAQAMMRVCASGPAAENDAARLGAFMAETAACGQDKLTLIVAPTVCTFGDWAEQLIAESTGKDEKGILPVVGEVVGAPEEYGADRAFVYLQVEGDTTFETAVRALEFAGRPVARVRMQDRYDLGAQFWLWEMATAVAGWRLGIQPFDQPDVESAKLQARQMTAAYQREGRLPELTPALATEGVRVYGNVRGAELGDAWASFLVQARPGGYIALQAYLPPSEAADASLVLLKTRLRQATGLAVTSGYGPRFLHSTGQLHKGDAGNGLFVQITAAPERDAPVPDEAGAMAAAISFGVLISAQALGDRQALLDAGRKVLRFHLESDPLVGLARLTQAIQLDD